MIFDDSIMTDYKQNSELISVTENVFNNTFITDIAHLTDTQVDELNKLWYDRSVSKNHVVCPSDIIFANTIPLPTFSFYTHGKCIEVLITPNNEETFNNQGVCVVGALRVRDLRSTLHDEWFYYLLCVYEETPDLLWTIYLGNHSHMRVFTNDDVADELIDLGIASINVWYSIQICLLNPVTKEIFSKPTLVKLRGKEKVKAKEYDRTIKYVKHYYIKDEDIDNALYGGDKSFNRKCLVWYVTGHWREYQSGKKVFIKGYWKGALRNTPPTDIKSRNRELIINESEVKDETKVV